MSLRTLGMRQLRPWAPTVCPQEHNIPKEGHSWEVMLLVCTMRGGTGLKLAP